MNERAAVVALVVLLSSSVTFAQELPDVSSPCAPAVTTNRRAVVAQNGAPGIWFQMDVARCMLGRLAALPLYAERVSLLQERLTLGASRDALLERQVTLAGQEADSARSVLETALRRAREAESRSRFERKLRWLWFAVGIVVVVGAEALSVWAWTSTR